MQATTTETMGKSGGASLLTAAVLLAGVAVAGPLGCGEDANTLRGSIGEQFSLDFDRVDITKQDFWLLIAYEKDASGGSVNTICKLVVDPRDLGLKKGKRISGSTFLERVTIYRRAYPGGEFPEVKSGNIAFEEYNLEQGGRVDGEFAAIFDNGRSLSGTFAGKVEVTSLE